MTVVLDEVKSAPGAEIEARFHSDVQIAAGERFTLLRGSKGLMVIIPAADGPVVMKPGSHSYTPVRKDVQTVMIPCAGSFTTAKGETTRLASIILPVRDEKEAAEIEKSVRKKFGAGSLTLSPEGAQVAPGGVEDADLATVPVREGHGPVG